MRNKLLAAFLGLIFIESASAVSVSFLKGDNFRDDLGYRKDKTTMTIENFAMWELGSVFFYYDITEPTTNDGNNNAARKDAFSNQFFGGISTPSPQHHLLLTRDVELHCGLVEEPLPRRVELLKYILNVPEVERRRGGAK